MSREVHVRFCERLGVRLPGPTLPPSLIELPAGSHTVRVEVKGQKPWSRSVSLTAGGKITLQAVLEAEQ
jgi:hypothetical protein